METTGDTEFSGSVAVVAYPVDALYSLHDDAKLEAQATVSRASTRTH